MPDFNQSLPLPPQDDNNDLPINPSSQSDVSDESKDAALNLIRNKVAMYYNQEPSAIEEEAEITQSGTHSKHQEFISNLMNSGADNATVQAKWHEYYQSLPLEDKRQVWNEFYNYHKQPNVASVPIKHAQDTTDNPTPEYVDEPEPDSSTIFQQPVDDSELDKPTPAYQEPYQPQEQVVASLPVTAPILGSVKPAKEPKKPKNQKSLQDTKNELLDKVTSRGQLSAKHHVQSLLFGLTMGFIVLAIFMFSFFNEYIISPFITPSRTASSAPIIIDPNAAVGEENLVIIPKINLEAPVVYGVESVQEDTIQEGLENGVVHYPSSPVPGQNGNVVVVGHSSNNIFNAGKYKFAFALLNYLETGDTIIMQYDKKRYIYKVYDTFIVKPTEVSVLGPTDKTATLTLITCDPPGRNTNRLIIRAEQISPDPTSNLASEPQKVPEETPIVPGNSPSLFSRLFSWL
jgi:LPXTG-site transpeptidase (sortase) family protein